LLPLIENPSLAFDLAGLITVLAIWGVIKCLIICWWPSGHSRIVIRVFSDSPIRQRAYGATLAAGLRSTSLMFRLSIRLLNEQVLGVAKKSVFELSIAEDVEPCTAFAPLEKAG
jgi:hypothetical protein